MTRPKLLLGILIFGFMFIACSESKKESKPTKKSTPEVSNTHSEVFINPEQMPTFPGGEENLLKFIYNNLHYPDSAKIKHIQGKVVVHFRITETGTIDTVSVIRALHPDCDQEAVRIVKSLPKLIPGKYNDKPVSNWYTLPITFKLPD